MIYQKVKNIITKYITVLKKNNFLFFFTLKYQYMTNIYILTKGTSLIEKTMTP